MKINSISGINPYKTNTRIQNTSKPISFGDIECRQFDIFEKFSDDEVKKHREIENKAYEARCMCKPMSKKEVTKILKEGKKLLKQGEKVDYKNYVIPTSEEEGAPKLVFGEMNKAKNKPRWVAIVSPDDYLTVHKKWEFVPNAYSSICKYTEFKDGKAITDEITDGQQSKHREYDIKSGITKTASNINAPWYHRKFTAYKRNEDGSTISPLYQITNGGDTYTEYDEAGNETNYLNICGTWKRNTAEDIAGNVVNSLNQGI